MIPMITLSLSLSVIRSVSAHLIAELDKLLPLQSADQLLCERLSADRPRSGPQQ